MVYKPKMVRSYAAYGMPEQQAYASKKNINNIYDDNEEAPDFSEEEYQEMYPNLEANFDGENFEVTNYGRRIGYYPAQSGKQGFQYRAAQDIPNDGPIPEGDWVLKYEDLYTDKSPFKDSGKYSQNSWGRQRVKITPVNANTYGRTDFNLHGSYNGYGSAGCIDLGLQMPHFGGIMNRYQQDIPLKVKYKNKGPFKHYRWNVLEHPNINDETE